MAWPKKKRSGAKPVTNWDLEIVSIKDAKKYLNEKAAAGWFIFAVSAFTLDGVAICSCQKVYPPPAKDAEAE